jgi:hypothetical protein
VTAKWKVGAGAALICLFIAVVAIFGPEFVLILPIIAFGSLVGWLRWKIGQRSLETTRSRMFAVPGPEASVEEMLQFGRATYRGDLRHRPEELAWMASAAHSRWKDTGKGPDSAQIARAALFFESTRKGSADDQVYDADYLRALVSRIRLFAPDGQIMADYPGVVLMVRRGAELQDVRRWPWWRVPGRWT